MKYTPFEILENAYLTELEMDESTVPSTIWLEQKDFEAIRGCLVVAKTQKKLPETCQHFKVKLCGNTVLIHSDRYVGTDYSD